MAELERTEILCIPKRRRLVHSREKGEAGQDVLHVFYGDKEIIFDEPELVPFGDRLLEVERFRADEAMAWSKGAPLGWDQVREMLEALLDQEILKRVSETNAAPAAATFPATLEPPPAIPRTPRTFGGHGCPHASNANDATPATTEAITQEAFGHAVDLGNLEVVVPVYRTAHAALDLDGRQVGENNVTPRALFLDLPTQRRVCNYAGSRCQADLPMNVTALKHMTSRWPELLSLTEQFRTAFFARLPPAGGPAGAATGAPGDGALRVGETHLLAVACLASVGYVMVRGVDPIPNGRLDAGLAAMFRLIDGVRLVTTEMMREGAGQHGCEHPLDAVAVAEFAERHAIYYGTHGVCAGPQALIDEYLRVLLGGSEAPIRVEPDLAARLGDPEAALDYGLLGQRVESLVRIFGAAQGLRFQRLRAAFEGAAQGGEIKAVLDRPVDSEHHPLLRSEHPLLETYRLEVQVGQWLFARAGAGAGGSFARSAEEVLQLGAVADPASRRRVAEFFAAVVPGHDALPEAQRDAIADTVADVFALEQRCLRAVTAEQGRLNDRLRRPHGRPLTGADLAVYTQPRMGVPLASAIGEGLGVSVSSTAAATVLRRGDRALTLSLAD